jgi:hypothetical protein
MWPVNADFYGGLGVLFPLYGIPDGINETLLTPAISLYKRMTAKKLG